MGKNVKRIINILLSLIFLMSFASFATNVSTSNYIQNVNPYYNYWKKNFIIYVDNYKGDRNSVSKKDLEGDKGTSSVYIFNKLENGDYNYDLLLKDIKNADVNTNLHDKKPILVLLPKNAANHESHLLLKNDTEKGKLFSGGPYSKYESYENGFYYKDKKIDATELNKILKEYKTNSEKIKEKLNKIVSFAIKDLYNNVHVAYMTNGATNVSGTDDSKIYLLNVEKKFSPYNLKVKDILTKDVIKGKDTKNYLPNDWQSETIYIYGKNNTLIEKMTFEDFKQLLWSKQDKTTIEWMKSLYN